MEPQVKERVTVLRFDCALTINILEIRDRRLIGGQK